MSTDFVSALDWQRDWKQPCQCGHFKRFHQFPGSNAWHDTFCEMCKRDDISHWPVCMNFKLDNLTHIELLAKRERSNLIWVL